MTASGARVLNQLQRQARASRESGGRVTTDALVTRHALESFLEWLQQTPHGRNFVLKGGILLAGYGVRRPTKDVDCEAISTSVTEAHIAQVVSDVAAVQTDDGLALVLETLEVQSIRDAAEYPGLRMRVRGTVGTAETTVVWDISMGDPVVPLPQMVSIPRLLGEPIEMLGYAPETTMAEKGVTILERGITSTRWRDYVDIVQLARHGIDSDVPLDSARAIQTGRTLALEQLRDRKRDSEDVDRRTRTERAEQADRVAAWPQRLTASDLYRTNEPTHHQQVVAAHTAGWGSMVVNRSELPIYDVSVTVYGPDGSPRHTEERATLSPGEVFTKWPGDVIRELEPLLDADGDPIFRDEGDDGGGYAFGVAVSFRDTAGRRWTRDRYGKLEYRGRIHFVEFTATI